MPCYTCLTHNTFILSPLACAPRPRETRFQIADKTRFFWQCLIARRSFSHGHIECLSHEYKILQSRIAPLCVCPSLFCPCVYARFKQIFINFRSRRRSRLFQSHQCYFNFEMFMSFLKTIFCVRRWRCCCFFSSSRLFGRT